MRDWKQRIAKRHRTCSRRIVDCGKFFLWFDTVYFCIRTRKLNEGLSIQHWWGKAIVEFSFSASLDLCRTLTRWGRGVPNAEQKMECESMKAKYNWNATLLPWKHELRSNEQWREAFLSILAHECLLLIIYAFPLVSVAFPNKRVSYLWLPCMQDLGALDAWIRFRPKRIFPCCFWYTGLHPPIVHKSPIPVFLLWLC